MRDAQLLMLDEPTAALDARAEYEVFLRFSELTKGRMAVLISHRFSTVRMADRILVLKSGELVEVHEALVELGGLCSEIFQLQLTPLSKFRQRNGIGSANPHALLTWKHLRTLVASCGVSQG